MRDWFKENEKLIKIGFLIILVASLSFGLGYLTNREFSHAPIIIERCSELTR